MKIRNKKSRRQFSARSVLYATFVICGITLVMQIPVSNADAQITKKEGNSHLDIAKDGTKNVKKLKRKHRKGRRGKRGRRSAAKVFVDLWIGGDS